MSERIEFYCDFSGIVALCTRCIDVLGYAGVIPMQQAKIKNHNYHLFY